MNWSLNSGKGSQQFASLIIYLLNISFFHICLFLYLYVCNFLIYLKYYLLKFSLIILKADNLSTISLLHLVEPIMCHGTKHLRMGFFTLIGFQNEQVKIGNSITYAIFPLWSTWLNESIMRRKFKWYYFSCWSYGLFPQDFPPSNSALPYISAQE